MLVHWLMDEGLMVKERLCPMCAGEMSLTRCEDRSDGLKWECRKQVNGKRQGRGIDQERKLVREEQDDLRRNFEVDILVVPGS